MSNLSIARTAIEKGQVYGLILAGGNARRLRGITDPSLNSAFTPKPNLDVLTGLSIDYSVLALEQMGIRNIIVLTTPQLSSVIESQIYRPSNPTQKVKMWIENRPLGTARAVDTFINHIISKMHPDFDQSYSSLQKLTFVIAGCDNPSNVGSKDPEQHQLVQMLDTHLATDAGATVGICRIPMHSREWQERSFATVIPDGLTPWARSDSTSEYEETLDEYYINNIGNVKPITGFCEQNEQKGRDKRLSNYLSTGFYAIDAHFWMDVIHKSLKHDFLDFGFDIFPAMASWPSAGKQEDDIRYRKIREAMCGYRFNAYFMPEWIGDNPFFWCDIGTPQLLLWANLRGLRGEFGNIPKFDRTWTRTPWGLVGEDTRIDNKARLALSDPNLDPVGNIIGRDCRIGPYVHLKNCVIGDHTIIEEKVHLENVVVLRGNPSRPNRIFRLDLTNGIISPGSIPGSRFVRPASLSEAILYRSPSGALVVDKLSQDE